VKGAGRLRLEGVTKCFDGRAVLDDVRLSFPAAGVVAIVGPNGSGKSTLLNVVTGFVKPDSGSCFLDGEDLCRMEPFEIARRGVRRTFQAARLAASLSVLANLSVASVVRRTAKATTPGGEREPSEALAVLRRGGLEAMSHASVGALSHGQQRLVAFACCVESSASVVVLDEPCSGLDAAAVDVVGRSIGALAREGRLVIMVEHNISMVLALSGRVVAFDAGCVVGDGLPSDVLRTLGWM
jgi:ABC-type branched-subunit amino acid transport system ATPase component